MSFDTQLNKAGPILPSVMQRSELQKNSLTTFETVAIKSNRIFSPKLRNLKLRSETLH